MSPRRLTAASCRGLGSGGVAGGLDSQVTCRQFDFRCHSVLCGHTHCSSLARVRNSHNNHNNHKTTQPTKIDIETQESYDPYCFQVSKFITRLLRHSQKVHREDDGAVHYDQVIDECKKKQYDYTEYWSVERKKEFVNAPHWPIEKWISVLAKGGPKKRFQYCLNPSYLHQFLYLRAIPGNSGSTIFLAVQDNVLLPEGFTEYGKELRSIVNHGLISGGVSLRTGRQTVSFIIVNPMDNQDGQVKPFATCRKQESRHTKILGNAFRIQYFGAI